MGLVALRLMVWLIGFSLLVLIHESQSGYLKMDLLICLSMFVLWCLCRMFIHVSLRSFWMPEPGLWAGCYVVYLCPGYGLELSVVGMLFGMFGYPVCGFGFSDSVSGSCPSPMFQGRCCPFVVFSGGLLASCIALFLVFRGVLSVVRASGGL